MCETHYTKFLIYFFSRFTPEFRPLVATLARGAPVRLPEVVDFLVSQEWICSDDGVALGAPVALAVSRGGHDGRGGSPQNRGGRGGSLQNRGGGGRSRGRGGRDRGRSNSGPRCQICNKQGHIATACWRRFTPDPDPQANVVVYGVDGSVDDSHQWFPSTGATNHATLDPTLLTSSTAYDGPETLRVGNGIGLPIVTIGSASLATNSRSFRMSDVLHVPGLSSSLLSSQGFAKENNSDLGGEYKKLGSTLASLGIRHRKSCAYTHEQNGRVERKHRHVVETGLALMAQSSVPSRLWDYAFETAVYLINKMPTRVLFDKSPHYLLHRSPPSYSYLRVPAPCPEPWGVAPVVPLGEPSDVSALDPPVVPEPHRQQPVSAKRTVTDQPPARPRGRSRPAPSPVRYHTMNTRSSGPHGHVALSTNVTTEPTCFTQVVKFPEWRDAMDLEFNALVHNNTWRLVPFKFGMNVVGSYCGSFFN
ncbi:PREDICTED: uncharacterized protein LOC109173933 [Ipomoea nil]|uniref:uncharacterized protein LOC109173933 n=1 Tax=Ipomoea nil TaxID=35883 RepID=UPI000901A7A7|nr:PREDICTED: uncharacterized protein LOC109173933 [Ipomoea nil]